MIMGYIWTGMILLSIVSALVLGQGSTLAAAAMHGAQEGITLAIAIGGSLCLWSGVGKLMEKSGITKALSCSGPCSIRSFPTPAGTQSWPEPSAPTSPPISWGLAMPPPQWAFRRQSG